MKTTILPSKHSMNRTPCSLALLLIPFVLACLTLAPQAPAQCPQICDGNSNTALGIDALLNNTGSENTAIGSNTLSATTGNANTATGANALQENTTGFANTGIGFQTLQNNTSGSSNTAMGVDALFTNSIGSDNTAIGIASGFRNTASGSGAMTFNTTGSDNTASGWDALGRNTTGDFNTADGEASLDNNTSGNNNTANGFEALLNNTTGSFNIAIGNAAGSNLTTGINNIDIGNDGVTGESKTIRIGTRGIQKATFIAGIGGATVPTGIAVLVDANGRLGTTTSSARFKDNIRPMDKASEAILALQPVIFRYKHDLDPEGIPQFGLVAEQVEKVNPDLVARDEQGKPYTVRYDSVNAMLFNEFLKEHHKVELQESKIAQQDAKIARQQEQIETLTAGLQKVTARLELSEAVPKRVSSN